MRVIAFIIFALSVIATALCGWAFLFWAWVTATPLTAAELTRARYNANVWLGLTGMSVFVAIASLVWAIRLGRRRASIGFEVAPRNEATK